MAIKRVESTLADFVDGENLDVQGGRGISSCSNLRTDFVLSEWRAEVA